MKGPGPLSLAAQTAVCEELLPGLAEREGAARHTLRLVLMKGNDNVLHWSLKLHI